MITTILLLSSTVSAKSVRASLRPTVSLTAVPPLAAAKYSDGSFTWHIDLIQGREGADWYYRFGAILASVGEVADYARSFHVQDS